MLAKDTEQTLASNDTEKSQTKQQPTAPVKKQTTQAPAKPKENTQKTKSQTTTTYKVKKGDTLAKISRIYGTTVEAIQAANGMKNTNLQIDQVLKIPAKSNSAGSNVVIMISSVFEILFPYRQSLIKFLKHTEYPVLLMQFPISILGV